MDDTARGAGCRIVPGCGVAPGLTNVLARLGADRLDTVDSVRFASYITHPITTSPGIVYTRFDESAAPASSTARGRARGSAVVREEEVVAFPPPYAAQPVHRVPHPEPLTLPRYLPGVRNVDFKVGYPEDDTRRLRALLELGFDDAEPFEIAGARIVPRDFAAAFVGRLGLGNERTANVKRVVLEGTASGEADADRLRLRDRARGALRLLGDHGVDGRGRGRPSWQTAAAGLGPSARGAFRSIAVLGRSASAGSRSPRPSRRSDYPAAMRTTPVRAITTPATW
jgi:hypothetical protein